ncbi:MAG TPA: hypothetical protein EYP25_09300 [Anaerolineae bacterium]|nr:hypothetical protein [Anaerolineae bacterium]
MANAVGSNGVPNRGERIAWPVFAASSYREIERDGSRRIWGSGVERMFHNAILPIWDGKNKRVGLWQSKGAIVT